MNSEVAAESIAGLIDVEDAAGVRILKFHRPPVNALNLDMAEAILGGVLAAAADDQCRSLMLTGLDGVFSGGIDTKEVPNYTDEQRSTLLRTVNRLFLSLYGFPKPVVAAISGHALGGGLALALTADYRLVADGDYKLGLVEAQAGVPFPAGALQVVRAELTPQQRRVLAICAASLSPTAPELSGIIEGVVARDELVDRAAVEAGRLTSLPGFGAVKQQLRQDVVERLERIVDHDEEPLHTGWIN